MEFIPDYSFSEPLTVAEVDPHIHRSVLLTGQVLVKDEDHFILDDGSGSASVFVIPSEAKEREEKEYVRVFGKVLPTPDGFEIQAEAVQKMENINLQLQEKVNKYLQKTFGDDARV